MRKIITVRSKRIKKGFFFNFFIFFFNLDKQTQASKESLRLEISELDILIN